MKSIFGTLDSGEDLDIGVDAWESTGILSAVEAAEADKKISETKKALKIEEERHDRLAAEAKDHVKEISRLLEKVELSTASKAEMERLEKLDVKMKRIKDDLLVATVG